MGLHLRAGLGVLTAFFMLAAPLTVSAKTYYYETCYQAPEELENYIVLEEDFGEYEVQEGDCLWNISERLLGNGEEYPRLVEMNPELILDPDLIYPHTFLQMSRKVYVRKKEGPAGLEIAQLFRTGVVDGCTVGLVQAGEAYASMAFMRPDDARILCRIRDREQGSEEALAEWEECCEAIEEYAEKEYEGLVTDLAFEHYQSETGEQIYLFSYTYTVQGEKYGLKGTLPVYVSHGICQAEHIQAEFVGFHTQDDMEDVVRYLAASFEELPDAGRRRGSVNDNNITFGSTKEWDLPGVYNSFGWMEEYFDGIFSQAARENAAPEDRSAKDRVLHMIL